MKRPKLVVIEWDDTCTFQDWGDGEGEHPAHCVSVGWLLKKDKESIILSGMINSTHSKRINNNRTHIPRGCIRSIRVVE